ncbi:MAG: T9SS type A sorting domain-containing protein [Flavobacteriales bacterium]|nr:T9SS type A sorting domain-containing protein [Flavobacteriales bacterium]
MRYAPHFSALLMLFSVGAVRAGGPVTFIKDPGQGPDAVWQQHLRHRPAWQHFLTEHGTWYVEFNEATGMPHRAFGRPVPTTGQGAEGRAWSFLQHELPLFNAPLDELEVTAVAHTGKYDIVHFRQRHEGLDVLFAHALVKLDQQGRVVSFGIDLYPDIDRPLIPTISEADAMASAGTGLGQVISATIAPGPRLLPIPLEHAVEQHLVYEVNVRVQNGDRPGNWLCWVDADNGELLYRQDRVVNEAPPAGAEITLTDDVEDNPWLPSFNMPVAHAQVIVNGTTMEVDDQGYLNTGVTGPVNATLRLQGPWSTVRTGGTTPSMSVTLQEGANDVSFNSGANVRERSAYFHVNTVHDHMKSWLPTFTGMDFSLPTNVDVGGNCNAYYDGSSINFYAEGNDCQSYALIGEVVYHEYGHGINDNYYQSLGGNWINGAMGEGYADLWALSITEDPILAEGSSLTNPDDYIRRYDVDPKVYPVDLVGEVHADGEIIAGAWWDTYVLLGNDMNAMFGLFIEAYAGLQATAADGNEGQAFRDVLLDALQADDDDGDITNGTPNGNAIVEAFGIHGITLLSNAEIQHTPVTTGTGGNAIPVAADLVLTFPFTSYVQDLELHYTIDHTGIWSTVPLMNTGGSTYEASIPGQPIGTVVGYYLGVLDIFQQLSGVLPVGAAQEDPNVPYYILVGYDLQATEDCDEVNELGNWQTGIPSDNATTGEWELTIPIPSYGTVGDPSTIVQTGSPHTPGGELCFVTGNGLNASSALGDNDVDGGTTTLMSDAIDLSQMDNPTFTYWRWYVNNPPSGANPGMDWWQTFISNNDGASWVPVEETRTSDRSWRRMAFRVQDYVTPTSTVRIKFNASDSIHIGEYLDGGSLVEAAVDDIQLWVNTTGEGIAGNEVGDALFVYPDPADDRLNVVLGDAQGPMRWTVIDAMGRIVLDDGGRSVAHGMQATIDVKGLSPGAYVLRVERQGTILQRRFQVAR